MKRVSLLVVGLLCLSIVAYAGEVITNDTGETATGLRITFSAPVIIVGFGDILASVDSQMSASEFVFSGGTVVPWESHWFNYAPVTASVMETEWYTESLTGQHNAGLADLGDEFLCGAFAGGTWGLTYSEAYLLPEDHVAFLQSLNARWVGLCIDLTIDNSMSPVVRLMTEEDRYPTFGDEELRTLICRLRQEGFRVYMTPAFSGLDDYEDTPVSKGIKRYQLGDPYAYEEDPDVHRESWPWDPAHREHEAYVAEFFRTYTEWAVYYAQIAEEEGVELYSLGTETDRLFRTRPHGSRWVTSYRDELTTMARQVRGVFGGALTYDMLYSTHLRHEEGEWGDSEALWGDLDLDVIGVSAYFRLLDQQVTSQVPSVAVLRQAWERIFQETLVPIQTRYPNKPIVFLEYGYNDFLGASANSPDEGNFDSRVWVDADRNGLDDGEEEQAAIHEALFQTVERNPGILDGLFLWGHLIATDVGWRKSFGLMRDFSVRDKLAADVVARWYGEWASALDYSGEEPCWKPASRTNEVLRELTWDDLPSLLSWEDSDSFKYWELNLASSESTATDTPNGQLDESALGVRSVHGAILNTGIAVKLVYAPGQGPAFDPIENATKQGPTDNPNIEFVLTIGSQRDGIFLSVGHTSAAFVGGQCGSQDELVIPWEFIDVGNDLIGITVPFSLVGTDQCLFGGEENRTLELTVAFRGQTTHAFIAYPGVGVMDILDDL